ncbi:MAG TPA: DUF6335 family protein [Vicinamibacterales bacterium]|nr:DUF6335 family protein [Vicinamibacterales bacterium]
MAKKASRRKAGSSSEKRSSKGRKRTPSNKRAGAGTRASARSVAGKRRVSTARRKAGGKTAGAKKAARKRSLAQLRAAGARAKTRAATGPRVGGTGMERELAQTPQAGRSVRGPTNPMPTKRSTGTAAGAGSTKRAPGLERERKRLRELEEGVPTPPSSLDLDRRPSAARSGRRELQESRREHPEVSPELTAGDVDADWEDAYSVGDEAPGGDNPTPDQDRVDDIGKALGVQYDDNEELKGSDKISQRDRHRWELDPASSDDYRDRD